MPSLILRLEQFPDAPREPDSPREPGAQGGTLAPHAGGEKAAVAEDTRTAAHGIGTARRVVDVASQERMTTASSLSRWSAAVAAAHDPCFVLDIDGVVISVSVPGVELLGWADSAVIGRHLLDVLNLVDLDTGAPRPQYAPRIPPLVVLDGPGLARSITRIRYVDDSIVTLDTSSVPVHDVNGRLVGSVTFIAPIPAR